MRRARPEPAFLPLGSEASVTSPGATECYIIEAPLAYKPQEQILTVSANTTVNLVLTK